MMHSLVGPVMKSLHAQYCVWWDCSHSRRDWWYRASPCSWKQQIKHENMRSEGETHIGSVQIFKHLDLIGAEEILKETNKQTNKQTSYE